MEETIQDEQLPFVTVIMPVRNEERYIRRSLNAVLEQDYPADRVEVLVVDGQSTDQTREILGFYQYYRDNLKIIDNPSRIVPTGLNKALGHARGQIIVRVDGHCEIAPDYVSRCVAHLEKSDVMGVGGPIETIGETYIANVIAVAMSSRFGVGGSAFRTVKDRPMLVDTVAFPAYRIEAIKKAGLFDEELVRNQDDEFNYRLRDNGAKILLSPDIRSQYYSRASLKALWNQYFQYGYWKVRVLQKHPRQMQLRQFVPPLFVATLLATLGLALAYPWGKVLLALVAGAYLLVNLAASFRIASHHDWRLIILLPVVFGCLHISYGLGFLIGLVRFAGRWGDKRGLVPLFDRAKS